MGAGLFLLSSVLPLCLRWCRRIRLERTQDGTSPLYTAAAGGHVSVVNALIERGANINQADKVCPARVLPLFPLLPRNRLARYRETDCRVAADVARRLLLPID